MKMKKQLKRLRKQPAKAATKIAREFAKNPQKAGARLAKAVAADPQAIASTVAKRTSKALGGKKQTRKVVETAAAVALAVAAGKAGKRIDKVAKGKARGAAKPRTTASRNDV